MTELRYVYSRGVIVEGGPYADAHARFVLYDLGDTFLLHQAGPTAKECRVTLVPKGTEDEVVAKAAEIVEAAALEYLRKLRKENKEALSRVEKAIQALKK